MNSCKLCNNPLKGLIYEAEETIRKLFTCDADGDCDYSDRETLEVSRQVWKCPHCMQELAWDQADAIELLNGE